MPAKTEEYIVSYAQNREDVLLAAFFLDKTDGFYVDVGANDPEADSVTKYFYDRGWHGINIEPSPRLYNALSRARPRDTNLNIGVSDKKDTLSFREYSGHGLSTFSKDTKAEHESGSNPHTVEYSDYDVPVRRLDDILAEQKVGDIDFMKIDVEGYEYEVIAGNDWTKYRPRLLCIEANHVFHDWHPLLKAANYKKVFFDGLNEYFVDANRPTPEFAYVKGVIGRPIVNSFADEVIRTVEKQRNDAYNELDVTRNALRESRLEVERINAFILDRMRLRNLVRDLVRKVHSVILLRLNNHMKPKRSYPAINLDAAKANTPEAVLQAIQVADSHAFHMPPTFGNRLEMIVFGAIRFAYLGIAWVGKKFARGLLKIFRLMKKDGTTWLNKPNLLRRGVH